LEFLILDYEVQYHSNQDHPPRLLIHLAVSNKPRLKSIRLSSSPENIKTRLILRQIKSCLEMNLLFRFFFIFLKKKKSKFKIDSNCTKEGRNYIFLNFFFWAVYLNEIVYSASFLSVSSCSDSFPFSFISPLFDLFRFGEGLRLLLRLLLLDLDLLRLLDLFLDLSSILRPLTSNPFIILITSFISSFLLKQIIPSRSRDM
jgi:hypothetical protein